MDSDDKVSSFINDIQQYNSPQSAILSEVRKIFLKNGKSLTEGIKYGGIVFFIDDQLIGGIYAYKKHISVEFSHGADLPDPNNLLQGKGKFRRHLKLCSFDDIKANQVEFYVRNVIQSHVTA